MYKKSEHIITSKHYLVLSAASFILGVFMSAVFDIYLITAYIFSFVVLVIHVMCRFIISILFLHRLPDRKSIILPTFLLMCFCFGVFRINSYNQSYQNKFSQYDEKIATIRGMVATKPKLTQSGYYYQADLYVSNIIFMKQSSSVDYNVRIYFSTDKAKELSPGDEISCHARMRTVDIDYTGRGIVLTGKAKNFTKIINLNRKIDSLKTLGLVLRAKVSHAISSTYKGPSSEKAVLNGILTGDKSDFTDELYDMFSNSGTSHIVAVSGMHTGILFSALIFIMLKTFVSRKKAVVAAMPFVIVLASAACFSPSVCRSTIMLSVSVLSMLLSERYDSVNALFLSALIILICSPYTLFTQSFVLSFSATLGILVFYRLFHTFFSTYISGGRVVEYIISSVSLTLSALLPTTYFCILFFNRVSLLQVFSNLLAVPLVPFIFCGGALGCLIFYISPTLSAFVFSLTRIPLRLLLLISRILGKERFVYWISVGKSPYFNAAIYFTAVLLLYLLLKTFSDEHYYTQRQGRE